MRITYVSGRAEVKVDDDINGALARLSQQPVPGALAQTEITVLDRIAALGPRLQAIPASLWAAAVALALFMGIVGGALPTGREEPPLFPLAPESRLAPSALLTE